MQRAGSGDGRCTSDWPCPAEAMDSGRAFIREAAKRGQVVLAPDKDADGLCAGAIMLATLQHLGAADVKTYFIPKGANIHQGPVLQEIAAMEPGSLIVLDQGSRPGALLPGVPTLIIDHHQSKAFPDGAQVVSAYGHEPVATSAMLAYLCCLPLIQDEDGGGPENLIDRLTWLAIVGTFGDLGTSHKWAPPWPDLNAATKRFTRKALSTAVSLVNAPRRTADGSGETAWKVILEAQSPKDIADGKVKGAAHLQQCRAEINAEIARCARIPPKFSDDGKVALITLSSPAQVHPVIATRWSSSLKGKTLQTVMVANHGFLPDRVNFAMRIAKSSAGTPASEGGSGGIDLIAMLKDAAAGADDDLAGELGADFARGHAQATGGSVTATAFAKLLKALTFEGNGKSSSGIGGGKRGAADAAANGSGKKVKTLMSFGFKRNEQ